MKTGIVLMNIGTPASPAPADVKTYLKQFLNDPLVITLRQPWRWLLVNAIIVPFRYKKSAENYQRIWRQEGSPLLTYQLKVAAKLQAKLADDFVVTTGMRYGKPSIKSAIEGLLNRRDITRIVLLPFFPQYSSAATLSAILEAKSHLSRTRPAKDQADSALKVICIDSFYDSPEFINSYAALIQQSMNQQSIEQNSCDHILFSYHGLPEEQIRQGDASGSHCLSKPNCCEQSPPSNCYRAQCFATSRLLARELGLSPQQYSTSFQSRLGKTPWIKPYTDEILHDLRARNIKNLVIACPAFTVDCLETLEEIGMGVRSQWLNMGGASFNLVPCLNDSDDWIDNLKALLLKRIT